MKPSGLHSFIIAIAGLGGTRLASNDLIVVVCKPGTFLHENIISMHYIHFLLPKLSFVPQTMR